MNTSKSGYEISDQDKKAINPKVLCCKCKNIVRNALQTSCGHRYCAGCLDNDFKGGGLTVCVVCGQPLTRNEVFKDKFVDREVQSLILYCIYVVFGCEWKGELRNREEHQKSCEFAPVGCIYPQCDKQFPKNRLADHLQDECLYRELICSFCKQSYEAVYTKKHEEQCPSFPVTCPSCNKEYPRYELDKHRDPYSFDVCEAIEVFCPFVPTGCKHKKPMKHDERKVHLEKNKDKHLSLFEAKVLQLLPYLEDLIPGLSHPSKGFKNGKLVPDLQMIEDQITSVKTEVVARIQELEYKTSSLGYPSLAASSYGVGGAEVKDLVRRLDNNDAKSASQDLLLNEAHATIAQLSQELAKANQRVEKAEESMRKLEKRLADQEQLAGLRNLAIADLEEKLKDNIGCSYDGILLFKITQVARKRADAVSGRQISFYSPAFYTDPHGYKMCARVYLNGDGMGKGTHISLFFVIMRGEYDALLRWPFRQKVTMMLMDQDNEEHVIDAFRPDPNSSSFQKPRGEMNIASGCPLFCPHSELQRHAYIRDDTMFIKMIVDRPDWK